MLLSGIFPPITTPFYPEGNIYHKKIESNVERYSRTPVAGMVVLGSTGEAILLSDEERREVLKTAMAAAAPQKVMIAGTGVESAHGTLRLTDYAAELGYDAALVRTPHYYKKQMLPANVLAFYRTVADRSPLPIIIYNFPGATGYDMPAELVIELGGHVVSGGSGEVIDDDRERGPVSYRPIESQQARRQHLLLVVVRRANQGGVVAEFGGVLGEL